VLATATATALAHRGESVDEQKEGPGDDVAPEGRAVVDQPSTEGTEVSGVPEGEAVKP